MSDINADYIYAILKAQFRKFFVEEKPTLTRPEITKILESFFVYDSVSHPIIQKVLDSLEDDGLIKRAYSSEREADDTIYLYCGPRDTYLEILNDGKPLPESEIRYLKSVLLAALHSHSKEIGSPFWSKSSIRAFFCLKGAPNELEDPQIKGILRELEEEGQIKLMGNEEAYLEFLG